MKANSWLLALLLAVVALASCKRSSIAEENKFETSYRTWLNFKASSNNSYRYMVTFTSWTGASTETVITVKEGKPVQRAYLARWVDPSVNQVVVREEWVEEESTLNSHPDGFAPVTLDEIYQKAKTEWLVVRKDASTYFETGNNGMISACGYVQRNCADDCFTGVHIRSIEKL